MNYLGAKAPFFVCVKAKTPYAGEEDVVKPRDESKMDCYEAEGEIVGAICTERDERGGLRAETWDQLHDILRLATASPGAKRG